MVEEISSQSIDQPIGPEAVVPEPTSTEVMKSTDLGVAQPKVRTRQKIECLLIVLGIFSLLGLTTYVGYRYLSGKSPVAPPPTSKISPITEKPEAPRKEVVTATPNITLETGFSFHLPEDWEVKISSKTQQYFYGRFFLPNTNREETYVEIESGSVSKIIENPLITLGEESKQVINNIDAVVASGRENFQSSNRLVKVARFNHGNNLLVITLVRSPNENVEEQFDYFIESVIAEGTTGEEGALPFVKQALAAEDIAGIPANLFQMIEVMGDPLPERLGAGDYTYRDGYAKFYKFYAFKGQRLTTVALEDQTTTPGSFIRSELLNESGNLLDEKDTRIEFNAPYSGWYYLIVSTFGGKEGGYLLKVFDRNQTENLVYLKFGDGSEVLVDYNTGRPLFGERSAAVLLQFVNPVELIENRVRYFATPKEFEAGQGLITSTLEVFIKKELYREWLKLMSNDPEFLGNSAKYQVSAEFTKISQSKILVEMPGGEMFPAGYHVVIKDDHYLAGVGFYLQTEEDNIQPPGTYSVDTIEKCGRIANSECDADCTEGYYEDGFFDNIYYSPQGEVTRDYRLTAQDKEACFAFYSVSTCGSCEKDFRLKKNGIWEEVSCEEMFQAVEDKNYECGNCVESFQEIAAIRNP